MKKTLIAFALLAATALPSLAGSSSRIAGDYLEVRSCDVFTGPCFANAEMGLTGKEGMMVWSIREGSWDGISLNGLSVIAVVRADGTLGDVRHQPRNGRAVLVVDAMATSEQAAALAEFAKAMSGKLIGEVSEIKRAPIQVSLGGSCNSGGCASVKAGKLVEINTRCLGGKDHLCGNEERFYPPLTEVKDAAPAFTEVAAYKGSGLNLTWESTGTRSAYLGHFVL